MLKKSSYVIALIVILSGCSSDSKCVKYNNEILSIKDVTVSTLTISKKYPPLKQSEIVVVIEEKDYSSYTKIGEVEIVCPLDCSDIQRSWASIVFAIDTKKFQQKEINNRSNRAWDKISEKIKAVAIANGADGIYLTGITTDMDEGYYSKEITLISGCMNYIFCKYDLLKRI